MMHDDEHAQRDAVGRQRFWSRRVILLLLVMTLALVLGVSWWFLGRDPYVYEGQLLPRPNADKVRAAVRNADVRDTVNEDDAYVLCEFILRIPGAGRPRWVNVHSALRSEPRSDPTTLDWHVVVWTTSKAYYFQRRNGSWRIQAVNPLVE